MNPAPPVTSARIAAEHTLERMPTARRRSDSAALRAAVEGVAERSGGAIADRLTLERPPQPELGDYSTNAALLLAPALGSSPREIAEGLRGELADDLGPVADRIEVAGPGFLNLFLSDRWHREAVAGVLVAGARPGPAADAERVFVEFVSANPTGPVTAASGRGAAFGDSLARLCEFTGDRVEREYYMNDEGAQVRLFAESIAARMRGDDPPEDGYAGDYVAELAAELRSEGVDDSDVEALERARGRDHARPDRGEPAAVSDRVRHLVIRARAARVRGARGGGRRAARARPRLRVRGRDLAANDELRRTTRTGC